MSYPFGLSAVIPVLAFNGNNGPRHIIGANMKPLLLLMTTLSLSALSCSVMAADMMVNITQFAFTPAAIEVPAGTKVTWTNQDKVNHSVTSDAGAFSSPPLKQGDDFSYTFTTPGTYPYHCGYHSYMTGSVTVK